MSRLRAVVPKRQLVPYTALRPPRERIHMQEDLDRLLMEAQRARFTERRTEFRHAFARPVHIHIGREPGVLSFSRDMSKQGIGLITSLELAEGTVAVLKIHSTTGRPAHLKCELRWSDGYGNGWYLTGWKFISAAPAPSS